MSIPLSATSMAALRTYHNGIAASQTPVQHPPVHAVPILHPHQQEASPSPKGLTGFGPSKPRFTYEEDLRLLDLKDNKSLTWDQMAEYFHGRSSESLQNRYRRIHHDRAKLKAKTTQTLGESNNPISVDDSEDQNTPTEFDAPSQHPSPEVSNNPILLSDFEVENASMTSETLIRHRSLGLPNNSIPMSDSDSENQNDAPLAHSNLGTYN